MADPQTLGAREIKASGFLMKGLSSRVNALASSAGLELNQSLLRGSNAGALRVRSDGHSKRLTLRVWWWWWWCVCVYIHARVFVRVHVCVCVCVFVRVCVCVLRSCTFLYVHVCASRRSLAMCCVATLTAAGVGSLALAIRVVAGFVWDQFKEHFTGTCVLPFCRCCCWSIAQQK
jgi:hypothetical protein